MALFRGQTTTLQKIQAISTLNITTREEAVAFLRAISNIEVQIAGIIQRQNLADVSAKNAARPVKQVQEAEKVQEVEPAKEEPVTFEDEEEHTDTQKKKRVAKLKKALDK